MSTKLKAGTTTSGAVLDADTTGILEIQSGSTSTTAITVDGSQNVGIGTSSPTQKLSISSGATPRISIKDTRASVEMQVLADNVAGYSGTVTNYPYIFVTNNAERMRIDSSGNVGIDTNSPSTYGKLAIGLSATGSATNNVIGIYQSAGVDAATLRIAGFNYANNVQTAIDFIQNSSTNFQSQMTFSTNGGGGIVERMRIDSSGNLMVGGATAYHGGGISIQYNPAAPQLYFNRTSTTGTTYPCDFSNGGTNVGYIAYSNTVVVYATTSDYRLKENVAPMTGALDTISKLKPVTYNWKVDGSKCQGFIAHELAEVVPECVIGEKDAMRTEQYEISPAIPAEVDEDGKVIKEAVEAVMGEREVPQYQGIDTSFLVATLTAAIQELKAEFDVLKGIK